MYKECNVVMLPTRVEAPSFTKGHIVKCIKSCETLCGDVIQLNQLSISVNHSEGVLKYHQPQHLYITTNEEIKEGDWFISELNEVWEHNGKVTPSKLSAKIIATINKSLVKNISRPLGVIQELPQISQLFFHQFIEAYNNGNAITKAKVLYHWGDDDLNLFRDTPILKVNYDNTVNIQLIPTKDSWNREEVIVFLNKLKNDVIGKYYGQITNLDLPKWIEENL